jgi:glycosyltransferase involved in cell wall biosynthesis
MENNYMLIEVSYEIGNKVGGIWTVITSKAPYVEEDYLGIGYYNPAESPVEFIEEEMPPYIAEAIADIDVEGLKFKYGTWTSANKKVILIDSRDFKNKNVNQIKGDFWNLYKIDSLGTGDDYNDPLAWSYAAGMLIEALSRHIKKKIVVQVHEWLSGGAILYLKSRNLNIPTVFTTHATVLGRAYSYAGNNVSDLLRNESIDDSIAYKFGVAAKHLTEKAAAHNATVFTAVSDIVAREAKVILGREPDIVTVNGIDTDYSPSLDDINKIRVRAQEKFLQFVSAYFLPYYEIDVTSPLILTSGRYEFYDKGFDLFIDSLAELEKRLPANKNVIAILAVPSGTYGLKNEFVANFLAYNSLKEEINEELARIEEQLETEFYYGIEEAQNIYNKLINDIKSVANKMNTNRNPPICPFMLSYPEENDAIISYLKKKGLVNSPQNKVKVIFYPKYLTFQDEVLRLTYKELLTVARVGVFLSRYEPFGYTPLEAMEYGTPAVTTTRSGLGIYLIQKGLNGYGNFVESIDESDAPMRIANILLKIVSLDYDHFEELRLHAKAAS